MSFVDAFEDELRTTTGRLIRRSRIRRRAGAAVAAAAVAVVGFVAVTQVADSSLSVDTVDDPDLVDSIDPDPAPGPAPTDDDPAEDTTDDETSGQDDPSEDDEASDVDGEADPDPNSSSDDPDSTGDEETAAPTTATTSVTSDPEEPTVTSGPTSSETTTPATTASSTPTTQPIDPATAICPASPPADATRYAGQALIDTGWLRGTGPGDQPAEVTIGSGRIGVAGGRGHFALDSHPNPVDSEVLTIEFDRPLCLVAFGTGGQRFNRVAQGSGDVGFWLTYDHRGGVGVSGRLVHNQVAPGSSVADGQPKTYHTGATSTVSRIDIVANPIGDWAGNATGDTTADGSSESMFSIEWIEVSEPRRP